MTNEWDELGTQIMRRFVRAGMISIWWKIPQASHYNQLDQVVKPYIFLLVMVMLHL